MATAPILHFSKEEENDLRMNLLLTKISPKAVGVLFNKEFPPTCLYATTEKELSRLNDLKKKQLINSSQWSLLFPRNGVPDSKKFDVILMITLLMNLLSLPAPISGYDQLPLRTDTTTTADLTRIEYYKTKLASCEDGHMGSSDFSTAWEVMIGAIGRLGGAGIVAECEELRSKQLYHSTQDSEKRITHIDENDYANRERYSKVSQVFIGIFPNILRVVICSIISASKLYRLCLPHLNSFSPDQKTVLTELQFSNSYDSMGIELIYKLLRQLVLVPQPTKGWGNSPDKTEITLADDVERIRYCTNLLAHRPNANIGKDEFDDYFDQFREIGIRMDLHFSQKTCYEQMITAIKTNTMDTELMNKYKKALMEIEEIRCKTAI